MLLSGIIEKELSDRIHLTYFDVIEGGDFDECLNQCLPSIWFGPKATRSIEVTKAKIAKYFASKLNNRPLICGSCAEIFLHAYLGHSGYQQACLGSNLEEGSIKKGFDGFYLKDNEYWLMESKSSIYGNIPHLQKAEEAYQDLCNKINDFEGNDPWENALNHAMVAGVEGSILNQISTLADDFTLEHVHDSSEFNMIPCGTVFIGSVLTIDEVEKLSKELSQYFENKDYSALHIVCVSHSALVGFLRYLNLEYIDE